MSENTKSVAHGVAGSVQVGSVVALLTGVSASAGVPGLLVLVGGGVISGAIAVGGWLVLVSNDARASRTVSILAAITARTSSTQANQEIPPTSAE